MNITVTNRKGERFEVQQGKRCPVCKYRIRGLNHNAGSHHRKGKP